MCPPPAGQQHTGRFGAVRCVEPLQHSLTRHAPSPSDGQRGAPERSTVAQTAVNVAGKRHDVKNWEDETHASAACSDCRQRLMRKKADYSAHYLEHPSCSKASLRWLRAPVMAASRRSRRGTSFPPKKAWAQLPRNSTTPSLARMFTMPSSIAMLQGGNGIKQCHFSNEEPQKVVRPQVLPMFR